MACFCLTETGSALVPIPDRHASASAPALGEYYLTRRSYMSFYEVSAVSRTIRFSNNEIGVNLRIAVLQGNIACQRQQFDLFV